MKSAAFRTYASALLISVHAFHAVIQAESVSNSTDVKGNSSSEKIPWYERKRPFVNTLIPPPYHTEAYHNPFPHPRGEDLSQKLYKVYDKTRIVGPEKNSKPSADSLLQARLSLLLKDRKKEQHVLKELDRRRSLPGDPYGTGGKRQLKGIPEFQDAHWISNMTTIQLQTKAPAWHGWFVLRMATNCESCVHALSMTEVWAHRAWHSAELHSCAQFGVIDVLRDLFQSPAAQLQAAASRPGLHWVPPLHEHHEDHQEHEVFRGPWTVAAVGQFINRQCARTARIGRVYAADILAAHFTTAAGPAERRSVREALRLLQLHHSDGSSDVHAKEYFRFYADIMEDALEATVPVGEYIEAEVLRLQQWLHAERFHDALTEVMAIRLNVLQAFRQSAAHPDDVHAGRTTGYDGADNEIDFDEEPEEDEPSDEYRA